MPCIGPFEIIDIKMKDFDYLLRECYVLVCNKKCSSNKANYDSKKKKSGIAFFVIKKYNQLMPHCIGKKLQTQSQYNIDALHI